MGLLLLIGQEKEDPSIVDELLDVEKNPRYIEILMFNVYVSHNFLENLIMVWLVKSHLIYFFVNIMIYPGIMRKKLCKD